MDVSMQRIRADVVMAASYELARVPVLRLLLMSLFFVLAFLDC